MELRHTLPPPACKECGAKVLILCPQCQSQIPGPPTGVMSWAYQPAAFCPFCAHPYPWASREAIVHHIENQLEEETDLPEGERRKLTAELNSLRVDPSDPNSEKKQVAALQFLKRAAPRAWNAAQPAIMSLATAYAKKELGL